MSDQGATPLLPPLAATRQPHRRSASSEVHATPSPLPALPALGSHPGSHPDSQPSSSRSAVGPHSLPRLPAGALSDGASPTAQSTASLQEFITELLRQNSALEQRLASQSGPSSARVLRLCELCDGERRAVQLYCGDCRAMGLPYEFCPACWDDEHRSHRTRGHRRALASTIASPQESVDPAAVLHLQQQMLRVLQCSVTGVASGSNSDYAPQAQVSDSSAVPFESPRSPIGAGTAASAESVRTAETLQHEVAGLRADVVVMRLGLVESDERSSRAAIAAECSDDHATLTAAAAVSRQSIMAAAAERALRIQRERLTTPTAAIQQTPQQRPDTVTVVHGEKHLPGEQQMLLVTFADGTEDWVDIASVQHCRVVQQYLTRKYPPSRGTPFSPGFRGGGLSPLYDPSTPGGPFQSALGETERDDFSRQLAALRRIGTADFTSRGSMGAVGPDEFGRPAPGSAAASSPRVPVFAAEGPPPGDLPRPVPVPASGKPPRPPPADSPRDPSPSKAVPAPPAVRRQSPPQAVPSPPPPRPEPQLPAIATAVAQPASNPEPKAQPVVRRSPEPTEPSERRPQPVQPLKRPSPEPPVAPEPQAAAKSRDPSPDPLPHLKPQPYALRRPQPHQEPRQEPQPEPKAPVSLPSVGGRPAPGPAVVDPSAVIAAAAADDVVRRYEQRVAALEARHREVRHRREENEQQLAGLRAQRRLTTDEARGRVHEEYEAHEATLRREQPEQAHPLLATNDRHAALLLHKLNEEIAQAEVDRQRRAEYRRQRQATGGLAAAA